MSIVTIGIASLGGTLPNRNLSAPLNFVHTR